MTSANTYVVLGSMGVGAMHGDSLGRLVVSACESQSKQINWGKITASVTDWCHVTNDLHVVYYCLSVEPSRLFPGSVYLHVTDIPARTSHRRPEYYYYFTSK